MSYFVSLYHYFYCLLLWRTTSALGPQSEPEQQTRTQIWKIKQFTLNANVANYSWKFQFSTSISTKKNPRNFVTQLQRVMERERERERRTNNNKSESAETTKTTKTEKKKLEFYLCSHVFTFAASWHSLRCLLAADFLLPRRNLCGRIMCRLSTLLVARSVCAHSTVDGERRCWTRSKADTAQNRIEWV